MGPTEKRNMQSFLVSIVVVNHNYGRFLRRAIESALAQNFDKVEVVVVDAGSTDESREIISDYGNRIAVVLQPCLGHVAAANAAFAASNGDLIIFLDADDELDAGVAAAVVAMWTPKASKVQYRLATIDAAGANQDMDFPHYRKGTTPASILADSLASGSYIWPVSTGNAFARRFLQEVMPIDAVDIFKSPDGFFNKLAPLYGDVLTLPMVLGSYRVHGENAWAQTERRVNVGSLERTVRLDERLDRVFRAAAARRGFQIREPITPRPNAIEIRFLAFRFTHGGAIVDGDTRIGLLKKGLISTLRQRGTGLALRLGWAAWFMLIAVAPLPVLEPIVRHARGQTGRWYLAKNFLRLGRSE